MIKLISFVVHACTCCRKLSRDPQNPRSKKCWHTYVGCFLRLTLKLLRRRWNASVWLQMKVINRFDPILWSVVQTDLFSLSNSQSKLLIISSGSRISYRADSTMLREDSRDYVSLSSDEPPGAQILFEAVENMYPEVRGCKDGLRARWRSSHCDWRVPSIVVGPSHSDIRWHSQCRWNDIEAGCDSRAVAICLSSMRSFSWRMRSFFLWFDAYFLGNSLSDPWSRWKCSSGTVFETRYGEFLSKRSARLHLRHTVSEPPPWFWHI